MGQFQNVWVKNLQEFDGVIEVWSEALENSRCGNCGLGAERYDSEVQRIYIVCVLGRSVWGVFRVNRTHCPDCEILTEKSKVNEGKKKYSPVVPDEVIRYSQVLDNKSVVRVLGLSPSTVYRFDRERLTELTQSYESSMGTRVGNQ